jgi:hypothetical protein
MTATPLFSRPKSSEVIMATTHTTRAGGNLGANRRRPSNNASRLNPNTAVGGRVSGSFPKISARRGKKSA